MNAIQKIMTGKSAKEMLPNIVEWTRHSSFTIATKSSSMGDPLHEREEEFVEVPVLYEPRSRKAGKKLTMCDGVKVLQPDAWFILRGSNTEPVLRVVAEAADEPSARALAENVRDQVTRWLS